MTPRFEKQGTRLRVTAPLYSTVSLRKGWRWKKLHDGRTWARYGLLAATPEFSLELPITDSVRVEAQGTTYEHTAEKPLPPLFRLKEWKRGGRFFLVSIVLHASVLALVVKLAANAMLKTTAAAEQARLEAEQAAPAQEAAQGASAPVIAKPFQGMSYSSFMKQMIETTGTAAERLKSLMGGGGISLGGGAQVAKSDKPIGTTTVVKSALGRNIRAKAPVATTAVAMKGDHIEEKDRVALKQSLADLQEDMRRVYSSALMIDPSLAVTAVLEMTVRPSGSLTLSGFQVKGKYTEAGLAKLRAGVAELVRGVKARAALSGTVVRAESAFIH